MKLISTSRVLSFESLTAAVDPKSLLRIFINHLKQEFFHHCMLPVSRVNIFVRPWEWAEGVIALHIVPGKIYGILVTIEEAPPPETEVVIPPEVDVPLQ